MNKEIIPLSIAILLILISLIIVKSTDYSLGQTHYIGIAAIFVSLLLYFTRKDIYVIVFGLTLIAGIIGLLDIFYINTSIGIGSLKINPIFLIILTLYLLFNRDIMDKMLPEKESKL